MNGSAASPAPTSSPSKLAWLDRSLIIAGFLVTTGVTSCAGFVAQDRASECQTIRDHRLEDVTRFRTVASKFEPLIAPYMGAALHNNDVTVAKRNVITNLREQRAELKFVRPHLDAQGQKTADKLDKAIVSFIVEADTNPTGVKVGPLYQELNYIFSNSQDLVAATNRATGMDSSNFTVWRFWGDC